jgi:hypothetical protein
VRPPGSDATCDRLACRREHGVPQSRPTPQRPRSSAHVGYPELPNGAHSLAGGGHSPRQRPVLGLRCRPPGPREPGTEHTCRRAPPSKHPITANAPDGARPATRWTYRPRISTRPASPGKAGFSRRHDGLRDRIYREAVLTAPLGHREYAPAVMRGLTGEQREALYAASAAALHCEAGGVGC